jgi:PAS domain S-box-containing protein
MQANNQESRLRAVVETARNGVVLIDSSGVILMFNPVCERLFGYTACHVIGQNVRVLMPSPFREEHDLYLENYQKTGVQKILGTGRKVTGRRMDGSTFPLHLYVGEAAEEGKSTFVGIIEDLSEHEKPVQAQMESSRIAGGIAHDLANLLKVMIDNAESLGQTLKEKPELKKHCDSILAAGAELTSQLKGFGRRTLDAGIVDCNELVEEIRVLLLKTLRADIRIATSIGPKLAPVTADRAELESALLNLAFNAQNSMPSGGRLTITTETVVLDERYQQDHPEVIPGDYVMIAVAASGAGVPADVQEEGGPGLSSVHGIVKRWHGHVSIDSEPGTGTTVGLFFPLAKSQAEQPSSVAGTVLVVEDDSIVRAYAVFCLESLNYRVFTAEGGLDALEKLERHGEIDILFSDIEMPGGMTGWELAGRARKLRPHLKILLTSGYYPETPAAKSTSVAILNKPYSDTYLGRHIRELLDAQE